MLSTAELTIHNPRTGDLVARVPIAGATECAAAIERARAAAKSWSRMPAAERASTLRAAAEAVSAAAEELAELNVR